MRANTHILLLCAFALTSCATPRERIRTVEVKVPVAVRCVEPGEVKPLPPKPMQRLPDDPVQALAVAVSWLADLWPWAVEAEGRLKGCAGE